MNFKDLKMGISVDCNKLSPPYRAVYLLNIIKEERNNKSNARVLLKMIQAEHAS